MLISQVDDAAPRSWAWRVGVWALFVGLTVAMTWPMASAFASRTVDHFDVFFNMWRLRWIHHALTTPGVLVASANPWVGISSRLSLFWRGRRAASRARA